MLDRESPVPLYRQVADRLRQRVADEGLKRLPSLETIKQTYEVSRPTAEAAVKILIDEGLAYISPGKGTFIRRSGDSTPAAGLSRWISHGGRGRPRAETELDQALKTLALEVSILITLAREHHADVGQVQRARGVVGVSTGVGLAIGRKHPTTPLSGPPEFRTSAARLPIANRACELRGRDSQ
jgi:GntR family transcriptional regulator